MTPEQHIERAEKAAEPVEAALVDLPPDLALHALAIVLARKLAEIEGASAELAWRGVNVIVQAVRAREAVARRA